LKIYKRYYTKQSSDDLLASILNQIKGLIKSI
jgi:hypothetical protein